MSITKDYSGMHDTELLNMLRWGWREIIKINVQEGLSEEMAF